MSAADARLKSLIDRVLRLKEEQDTLAADIREVYAEASSDGYNKTAMGQLVTYLRKKEKNGEKLAEQSAIFDLYLTAYERPSHAYARAGAELTESNPATGTGGGDVDRSAERASSAVEVGAPVSPERATEQRAVDGDSSRPKGRRNRTITQIATCVTSPGGENPASNPVANVGEGANGAVAVATVDPASRDADGADRQQPAASGFTGEDDGRDVEASGGAASVITNSPSDGDAFVAVKGKARLANAAGVEPSPSDTYEPEAAADASGDYLREPTTAASGQIIREGDAPRETGRFGGVASSPDTDFEPPAFLARQKTMADYRPNCLEPDACRSSQLSHCYTCRKALEAADHEVAA